MLLVCVSLSVGAQIVGKLDCSGIGTPMDGESEKSLNELWYSCAERNASLVESLKVDPHADKLLDPVSVYSLVLAQSSRSHTWYT